MNFSSDNRTEDLLVFEISDTIIVLAYAIMAVDTDFMACQPTPSKEHNNLFLVGIILNSLVLFAAGRNIYKSQRSRTNVHLLVFHLTIADSLVSFITMPMEAGWKLTMQWMLDDVSCRVLMVVRALGYYLSSNILVMICIDRYLVISRPLLTVQSANMKRRARLMITIAWVLSTILASCQALMWRLLKHPHNDFYQCTTLFRLEMESNLTFVEGEPVFRFYGTDPKIIYAAYNFSFLLFVYFLPLACIVCGFLGIFSAVKRRDVRGTIPEETWRWSNRGLWMSVMQMSCFTVFWAPYVARETWKILDPESVSLIPLWLSDWMLLTGVFNSCVNPIIYGWYYYKDIQDKNRPTNTRVVPRRESNPANTSTYL